MGLAGQQRVGVVRGSIPWAASSAVTWRQLPSGMQLQLSSMQTSHLCWTDQPATLRPAYLPLQGYTLFASAFIGGPLTGAALNPARVFGPALVYNCYWSTAPVYMIAEYLAGVIAALVALLLYGPGPEHGGDTHEADALAAQMAGGAAGLGAAHGSGGNKGERTGLISMTASGASGPSHQWDARF